MNTFAALLFSVHFAATAGMAGLIWFIQVVHYPLFHKVGDSAFVSYEQAHQRLTSWVVGPLMGAESLTAIFLVVAPNDDLGRLLPVLGLALLAPIHASTVFLQVPIHTKLSKRFDGSDAEKLVSTNWIRTIGWTLRTALVVVMLVSVIS